MKKKKGSEDFSKFKHKNTHHIVPTSRGGPNEEWNLYQWTIDGEETINKEEYEKKHAAWHQLFDNRLPSEAIDRIREEWTLADGKLHTEKLKKRKLAAWQRLFNDWSPEQVIRFIEEEFLPAEIRFLSSK